VRPIDARPADSPALVDSDEREGIGENLCQPPPFVLPLARAGAELPALPGLGAEPQVELPRVSGRAGELFAGPAERDPATWFGPDSPKRRKPLFELVFEALFSGLATSRPLPAGLAACRLLFEICAPRRSNERDAVAVLPRAEKKR
jgi:hypothetical protein